MKAVIYARYSSENQREESIEGQLRECTAYCQKNDITIVRSYIDRALSAKTDNRPDFQRMIKDSAKGLFDVVLVWKLDRFARNRYDSAHYKAQLKKYGVKVLSATENISEGLEGIILESLLEGMAEYYSAELAEKVIRVEVFGVECSIMARDLAWEWIGDAHERFSVGDQVLVRILNVRRDSLEDMGIKADIKSVSQNTNHDNLKKCRIQSKYAGKVTDVHKGVVYIRLSNGVNAVAHSCYDYRTPGKKDDVSFAVTRLDEERGVAVGIITRIIRQNL